MNIEITSEEAFKHFKAIRDGYIVIIDTTRRTIHLAGCPDVNVTSFREKVLLNTSKNGRYYFMSIWWKVELFQAVKCQNCRPK